jgi:hypothetical protein
MGAQTLLAARAAAPVAGAVAALLSLAAPASAMEVSMQDDQAIVYQWHDRPLALRQFRAIGGTHVRINVMHRRGPARGPDDLAAGALEHPLVEYDAAIKAINDAGLTAQLTLVWYGQSDPATTAAWMEAAARHFAPVVDRYSVLNEPDLTIPVADECDPTAIRRLISEGTLEVTYAMVRRKSYLRKRVRIRRRGKVFRIWRPLYRREVRWVIRDGRATTSVRRIRRYRWVKRRVAVARTQQSTREEQTLSLREGCRSVIRGRRYRAVFQAAAPAIRRADPGAQILAGETSPIAGFDLFAHQALPLEADGWAHHPYQWDLSPERPTGGFGIGDTPRIAALVGMPLYYTEFGYPRPGSDWEKQRFDGEFTESRIAEALPRAWQFALRSGVRQMNQFGWFSPAAHWDGYWDTALLPSDDGDTPPVFHTMSLQLSGA